MLRRFNNQRGATLLEYVMIALLILVACVLAMTALGTQVSGKLTEIKNKFN